MTTEESTQENLETEDNVLDWNEVWPQIQEQIKTTVTELLNPFQVLLPSESDNQKNESNDPPTLPVNEPDATTKARKTRKRLVKLNRKV